jgi:hypothetical protein
MGDKNFKWWCGGGQQPEAYSGPYDTREEALTQGKADYPEGHFTICEADKATVSFDMFSAGDLLERLDEHNLECWGEDGMDVHLKPEQERSLEAHMAAAFEAWMDQSKETPSAWCFGETRAEEYFPPVNDEAVA